MRTGSDEFCSGLFIYMRVVRIDVFQRLQNYAAHD
jgi:hypothetical protein